jgi:diguanylate cyclase (GGDEF)-like protein
MEEELLKQFINSWQWQKMKDIFINRLHTPHFWIVNKERELISSSDVEKDFCKMIKATPKGRAECEASFINGIEEVRIQRGPCIYSCHAGFLGFSLPLFLNKESILGVIGGCQIVDANLDHHYYSGVANRFSLDESLFLGRIKRAISLTIPNIEAEIEVLSSLAQTTLELLESDKKLKEAEHNIRNIQDFYKLYEESRTLLLTLEPHKLFPLIVELTAKALQAEICSLMLIDKEKNELIIKAAVGLDQRYIAKHSLKVGSGIVGYVAKTGEPLLVKDVTKDSRFHLQHNPSRYYTRSLISAPLKIGDEVLGIINVNNKVSRLPFDENDLKLLSIICGHAAVAIKHTQKTWTKEKEEVHKEIEIHVKEKKEIEKEKEILKEERHAIEEKIKETEEMISIKEELLKARRQLLEEKELHEKEEKALLEEKEKLEKELEALEKERERLLEESREKEKLIKEKEILEREKEELIKEKEELEAQTEELAILYAISREIPLMSEESEILRWVLDKIQTFYNYHAASFLFKDKDRLIGYIKTICYVNDACMRDIRERIEQKWRELTLPTSPPQVTYTTDEGEAKSLYWVGLEKFQSYLLSPLVYKGENVGILSINSFNENAFSPLQRRVFTIISHQLSLTLEKVKLFQRVKELAERDELTGVFNYRYFEDFLTREFHFASQFKRPLSLIMADFDHLKRFNDTYGHQEGNRLIVTIGDIIKRTVNNRGVIARFGGDEFAIILSETERNPAYNLAEEIRSNIASSVLIVNGKKEKLSASFGVATFPEVGINSEKDLLAKADAALYQAKQQGRNKVVLYMP